MNNDLISRSALIADISAIYGGNEDNTVIWYGDVLRFIGEQPSVDAVEAVRCQNCIHAEPFERNCELNSTAYMHCRIWRGEEVKNVWHKYKKYYRDYSVVDRDGFCDEGAPLCGERKGDDGI